MKKWTFLILLCALQYLCLADGTATSALPVSDSIASGCSAAPASASGLESVAESSAPVMTAPIDTLRDTLPAIASAGIPQKDQPHDKLKKRKKLIAALLAFPFPFGIIGLHRIYLGSKPYVPVVYITTLGGVGIIAFIDFVVLCLEKDISHYCDNPNIIMWAK